MPAPIRINYQFSVDLSDRRFPRAYRAQVRRLFNPDGEVATVYVSCNHDGHEGLHDLGTCEALGVGPKAKAGARLLCSDDGKRRVALSWIGEFSNVGNRRRTIKTMLALKGGRCPVCREHVSGKPHLGGGFTCPTHGHYEAVVGEFKPYPGAVHPEAFLGLEDGTAWQSTRTREPIEWGALDDELGVPESSWKVIGGKIHEYDEAESCTQLWAWGDVNGPGTTRRATFTWFDDVNPYGESDCEATDKLFSAACLDFVKDESIPAGHIASCDASGGWHLFRLHGESAVEVDAKAAGVDFDAIHNKQIARA